MLRKMMWMPVAAALALTAVSAVPNSDLRTPSSIAQQGPLNDPLLDHFTGSWVLRGTIDGKQTTHDVTVDWMLQHHYLRIHEVSREKNGMGQPEYEAMVFVGWNPASSEYGCAWLDVFGGLSAQSVGRAKRNGAEIPFVFPGANGDSFQTTFAWDSSASNWSWRMDSHEKGVTKPFARVTLTRN